MLLCAAGGGASAGEYVVRIDPALQTLDVTACFDAPVPDGLYPGFRKAPLYLRNARLDGRGLANNAGAAGHLPLGQGARSCLEYAVNIPAMTRAARFIPPGDAVLVDPGDWLWLPEPGAAVPQFLRFELPAGMDVSTPWPAEGAGRFRVDGIAREWSSLVAIGGLEKVSVPVPGAELRLAILPGSPPADHAFVRDWIRAGAGAITTIYGSFPVPSPQVLIVPIGDGGEPVPWGEVQRGGGAAAHLFIDQRRPPGEFAADWVLVHELGHLLHPNLGENSAWLSEGLATYYQNVARARAGMLGEQAAWQKLYEGFERGRAQTRPGQDLVDATRAMREERGFMRVYWSGAAIVLLADLALRDAGSSLDEALRRFRDCCLANAREWDSREFLRRLDELTGTKVFTDIAGRYLHSDRFPDLGPAYDRLGLLPVNGAIELDAGDASSGLRSAIMTPRR